MTRVQKPDRQAIADAQELEIEVQTRDRLLRDSSILREEVRGKSWSIMSTIPNNSETQDVMIKTEDRTTQSR